MLFKLRMIVIADKHCPSLRNQTAQTFCSEHWFLGFLCNLVPPYDLSFCRSRRYLPQGESIVSTIEF